MELEGRLNWLAVPYSLLVIPPRRRWKPHVPCGHLSLLFSIIVAGEAKPRTKEHAAARDSCDQAKS